MKYLILDTNIFVQDFRMNGNSFSALLSNFTAVADELLVPKVVQKETLNQYLVKIDERNNSITKNIKELNKLVGYQLATPLNKDLDELESEYSKYFDTKLNPIPYKELDYPSVSHESIAFRAIKKIKPFKSNGTGYCDTVIWESILEVMAKDTSSEVLFVTNNKKDFYEDSKLASELINDLKEKSIDPGRITTYISLKEIVDELLLPHLKTIEEIKDQINNNTIPDIDITQWIEENLFNLIDESDAGFVVAGVRSDECLIEISEIYEVMSVVSNDAKVLNENEKYISISTVIGLGINICADYYQYEGSYRVTEIFDDDGVGMPTPYDCVYLNSDVEVEISVIIKDNDFSTASIEIQSISGIGGFIDYDFKPKKGITRHSS